MWVGAAVLLLVVFQNCLARERFSNAQSFSSQQSSNSPNIADPTGKWNDEQKHRVARFKKPWVIVANDGDVIIENDGHDTGTEPVENTFFPGSQLTDKELSWLYTLGRGTHILFPPYIRDRPIITTSIVGRTEVRQLSREEWDKFVRAMKSMKQSIPDPSTGRSEYDIFVYSHTMSMAPGAHIGAAFLPWHREFLWR